MKLSSIRLSNFRCFEQFDLPLHPQLSLLVAPNGAGKTALLDAISLAVSPILSRLPNVSSIGPKETDLLNDSRRTPKTAPYLRIACKTTEGWEWDITKTRDKSPRTSKQIPSAIGTKNLLAYTDKLIDTINTSGPEELPIFVYYGTGRGVFSVPQRKRNFKRETERIDAYHGALESKTNFRNLVESIYVLDHIEHIKQKEARSFDVQLNELRAIRQAVELLLPSYTNLRVTTPIGIAIDMKQGDNTRAYRIEQLSDGYRTTLAMAMDIATRMAIANPHLANPLETSGIVLVDELEMHLHPGWQQTILLDLMRTFPNVQWVVSTHSPQIVSSTHPESLRVIQWNEEELPSLLPIAFSAGAEAQQVLMQVLGVKSPRVEALPIVEKLRQYQAAVEADIWDSPEAQTLRSELDKWGNGYDLELQRLDMDIRLKEWQRGKL